MSSKKSKAVEKKDSTYSERFIQKVSQEFEASLGHTVTFSSHEKQLATNLFLSIDETLKAAQAKNEKQGGKMKPYTWDNVNMQKLAQDAVHRVKLGLDAMIPNHIWPIPYMNSKTGLYDIDLRIGYKGKHHYRMKMATDDVKDIRYELVYESDTDGKGIEVFKKNRERDVESYRFEITNPFDRGKIIGGFAYIEHEDPTKNKLILVPEEHFQKVGGIAKSKDFWEKWPTEMRFKTLVHRATDKIDIDPNKVNKSYHYVEQQDYDLDPSKEVSLESDPEPQKLDMPEENQESQNTSGDWEEDAKQKGLPFGGE